MAIPNDYIDKITNKDSGESRIISPAADKVRVDNENFDGTDLDEVLDEVAQAIGESGSGDGTVTGVKVGSTTYEPTDGVVDLSTPFGGKVDKVTGYGLSKNDYTDADAAAVATIPSKANDADVVKSISVNGTAQQKNNGNVNISVPTVTFDDAPTAGSDNAVKSKGIKQAIDNKLTNVVINEITGAAEIVTYDDADLAFIDEDGNIAMQVADGHVKTQNFDSRQVATNASNIQQLQTQVNSMVIPSGNTALKVKGDDEAALDFCDENGRVALRITKNGHIESKRFNSANLDLFRETKLGSPQCICHGKGGNATGHANTLLYFRDGIARGYRFFECDAYCCSDGVPICTHQQTTYSVKRKSDSQVEEIQISQISSTELLATYTWADGTPIATLNEVIWFICYFHRFPLHIDPQPTMTEAAKYSASQYAESLGVGQYVFHERGANGIYNWDIPCNVITYITAASEIPTLAAANKKPDNNIIFAIAADTDNYTDETIAACANAAHAAGCYLATWTFDDLTKVRRWFKDGTDFIITSGIDNSMI